MNRDERDDGFVGAALDSNACQTAEIENALSPPETPTLARRCHMSPWYENGPAAKAEERMAKEVKTLRAHDEARNAVFTDRPEADDLAP